MTENLNTAALTEDELADDVIFEPSSSYPGRKVGIAIKNGLQVCWSCFKPLFEEHVDAIMGEATTVRICKEHDCAKMVGRANDSRRSRLNDGNIILLDGLPQNERLKILADFDRAKKKNAKH